VGAYYAGPGNRFWRMLHEIGLTPVTLLPSQFREAAKYGIGLTDVVKHQSGPDKSIRFDGPQDLADRIRRNAPGFLAFNGKKAAATYLGRKDVEYGLLDESIGETRLFVLPSTSGAANAFWDPSHWRTLSSMLR
jgi:TDG/mug DNA glycosylase family protein